MAIVPAARAALGAAAQESKVWRCCALSALLWSLSCSRPSSTKGSASVGSISARPVAVGRPSAAPDSFELAVAGDVNLGRGCGQRLLSETDYDPLRRVAGAWADADLRFVNLESALSEQRGETQSPRHGLVFTGPPVGADALARAGIGIVSTANNHAWDYARRGLFETLQNLDRVGIAHAGTGRDEARAYEPAVVRINGLKVAFFAVTQVWNLGVFAEEEARHHVAWADIERLRQALVKARAESDFVVVSYHGGEEYIDVPLLQTRAFVDEVMSLGVDVVVGHHPHVPQGVGWYGVRPVFYSLGNFVFDSRATLPWTSASFIGKLHFQRGRAIAVSVCPFSIDGFEPVSLGPLDVEARRAFEHHLRAISASVGGTDLGEADALGCVALAPPTRLGLPSRDRPRVDREFAPLGLR